MKEMNPLARLVAWVASERTLGTPFARGAVLGTHGADGMPHTRMLGVLFDASGTPRFHTSPMSRKVRDIAHSNSASLTFAFQKSLRSVSLEGSLEPLDRGQLVADWLDLDIEFRKNYLVFGRQTGMPVNSLDDLRRQQSLLSAGAEKNCPESFIGYAFRTVRRIAFYSVAERDFATHEVFELDQVMGEWRGGLCAP